jgi:hypothetical protein
VEHFGEVESPQVTVPLEAPTHILANGGIEVKIIAGDDSDLLEPVRPGTLANIDAPQPNRGLGFEECSFVEHGKVLGDGVEKQVSETVLLFVEQHDLPFLHSQRENVIFTQDLAWLL